MAMNTSSSSFPRSVEAWGTHWQYADLVRRRFPLVQVKTDVLHIDDGDVLTSADSTAGLDLCLHLVRRDHGPSVANMVARRLVITPHREGGQAQFIEAPVPRDLDDDRITRSMAWALALRVPRSAGVNAGLAGRRCKTVDWFRSARTSISFSHHSLVVAVRSRTCSSRRDRPGMAARQIIMARSRNPQLAAGSMYVIVDRARGLRE
jgi:hypothetical protein